MEVNKAIEVLNELKDSGILNELLERDLDDIVDSLKVIRDFNIDGFKLTYGEYRTLYFPQSDNYEPYLEWREKEKERIFNKAKWNTK